MKHYYKKRWTNNKLKEKHPFYDFFKDCTFSKKNPKRVVFIPVEEGVEDRNLKNRINH